jgi:regulator of protease activity HflC (stomatin/prohibitin superfamily)
VSDALRGALEALRRELLQVLLDNAYVAVLAALGVLRLMGKTVRSGSTGLKFSFGRARSLAEPGFHLLIPFFQRIETLPTRSRTIDLPKQRVTTADRLVYEVDVNAVLRVVDVRRALVEVDDLERAMTRMLAVVVQELLRGRTRADLGERAGLEETLAARLADLLQPWGVAVERAGITSIAPSRETLVLTQLAERALRRRAVLTQLAGRGLDARTALAFASRPPRWERRAVPAGRREARRRARPLGRPVAVPMSVVIEAAAATGKSKKGEPPAKPSRPS